MNIFLQIKYTKAILSNSARKLLRLEITTMPIVPFIQGRIQGVTRVTSHPPPMARKPISCYYAQISFSRKPRPPQCLLAWLARVPKVTPYKKNPRSVNVIVTFGTLSFAMCRRCGDYSVSAADDGTELSCVVTVPGLSPVTATAILSVRCKSTHY